MLPERTPGDLGSKLRAARERRGLSLRDIAASTKISVRVLEALERNDARRLPGGIFSRAFVRSYAAEVGLDPDQAARDFLAQFPDEPRPPVRATTFEDGTALESERRMASTFLALVAISIPVAAALVYFATAGRQLPAPDAASSQAAGAIDDARPREAPKAAPSEVERQTPGAPTESTAGETLTIVLTVTRPCWVAATVDGERVMGQILQTGEQRTINVKREVVLTAGDAAAVEMTLNGADARPLGKDGEVVTTRLNLANFKGFLASR